MINHHSDHTNKNSKHLEEPSEHKYLFFKLAYNLWLVITVTGICKVGNLVHYTLLLTPMCWKSSNTGYHTPSGTWCAGYHTPWGTWCAGYHTPPGTWCAGYHSPWRRCAGYHTPWGTRCAGYHTPWGTWCAGYHTPWGTWCAGYHTPSGTRCAGYHTPSGMWCAGYHSPWRTCAGYHTPSGTRHAGYHTPSGPSLLQHPKRPDSHWICSDDVCRTSTILQHSWFHFKDSHFRPKFSIKCRCRVLISISPATFSYPLWVQT